MSSVSVIIILGQSNASGRAEVERLANPLAQGFVANPDDVFIYYKGQGTDLATNLQPDNGSWVPYQGGVNSNFDVRPIIPTCKYFGIELPLSQLLSGKVYIIKCAIGGTSLSQGTTANPGSWNYVLSTVATRYFIKRALRDLKIIEPTSHIDIKSVVWWQGEQDAANGVSKDVYKTEFIKLKKEIDTCILANANIKNPYKWFAVKLNYLQTSGESVINQALEELQDVIKIDVSSSPRKFDLSTVEATPVSKVPTTDSISPVNAAGGVDNYHASYLSMINAANQIFNELIK